MYASHLATLHRERGTKYSTCVSTNVGDFLLLRAKVVSDAVNVSFPNRQTSYERNAK